MKTTRRIFAVFLIVVSLLLLLLLFTQTGIFKNLVRNQLIKQVNRNLVQAEFKLEAVKGSFLNSIILEKISLESEDQTILSIENISLKYKLIPLLKKRIVIESLTVNGIYISLQEMAPGSWNFTRILPPPKPADESIQTTQTQDTTIAWEIQLQDLTIKDLNVIINLLDQNQYVPADINNLNLQLTASYLQNELDLQVMDFNFHTSDPDFNLKNLTFNCTLKDNLLAVSMLKLDTEQNHFEAFANYQLKENLLESLGLEVQPLYLNEFQQFLPELPIKDLPLIFLKTDLVKDHLNSEIVLVLQEQSISLNASVDSLFTVPSYNSEISFKQVNIQDWLKNIELESHLNLDLQINGLGLDPLTMNGSVKLISSESTIQGKNIKDLTLKAEKNGDQADVDLQLDSFAGAIDLQGQLRKLFDTPEFSLQGIISDLDAGKISGDDNLSSDLNFSFNLSGKGKGLNDLESDFILTFTPSRFGDLKFNSLITDAYYRNGQYRLDQFSADISGLIIDITGSGRYNGDHDLRYSLHANDLSSLNEFTKIDDLKGKVSLTGSVKGNPDYLFNNSVLTVSKLEFNDILLDSLSLGLYGAKKADIIDLDSKLKLSGIKQGDLIIDDVELFSQGDLSQFKNQLTIRADSIDFYSENTVILEDGVTIELPYISLNLGQLHLTTAHDSARFRMDDNGYKIDNLLLTNGAGTLFINGFYTLDDFADIKLNLSDLDISQLNRFQIIPFQIQGILNFDTDLKGFLSDPVLNSEINVLNPQINEYLLQSLHADLNISNLLLTSDFQIVRNEHESLIGSAEFPVNLNQGQSIITQDAPLKIDLLAKDLELRFIEEFASQFKNINGILNLDFKIRNTRQDPKFSGLLTLSKGVVDFPDLGLKYDDIVLNSSFNNDSLYINNFYVKGGKGYLKATGYANFNQFLTEKNGTFGINITADDFHAVNQKNLEILTDLNVDLKGSTDKPVFSGKVEITRSKINLDHFKKNKSSTGNLTEPLLIQALAEKGSEGAAVKTAKKNKPDIVKNLTGKMKIKIPKNTWIRNKDMNIEISADLEVLKTGSYFEFFGYVKTIRGNYDLYGKKFTISEGLISFNGGEQLNPNLDLIVENIFRDINRNKRIMEIQLTGNALNPEIKFFLDNETISEADAVSFLLFGKSNNEISQSEKSQVSNYGQADFATTFLAKEIGSRITDQIAKKLNLNVIEFSGGDNLKSGSILIGKYITNDLFLSYQKEFSLDQSKEIVPDKVAMEYEISRYFSLQASRGDEKSTGIDLFWKWKKINKEQ